MRSLKGHGHWVNTLALSTECVLRTGAYDHTGRAPSEPQSAQQARTRLMLAEKCFTNLTSITLAHFNPQQHSRYHTNSIALVNTCFWKRR